MNDLLQAALAHHRHGRLPEARRLYEQLLAHDPRHADALHLLGVVAHQQGEHARALDLIGRAIALAPNVASFHGNLAEVYRALGQFDRAAGCCRTALRLQPDYPEAANHLGLALQGQGQLPEAAAQFHAALRLRPNFAMAHNNLGNTYRLLGDADRALEHFRAAVELQPALAQARSNLGQFLLEQQRAPEALEHCREAVRLAPNLAEAHSNLGNVLRELGQLVEARACYAEALRLDPNLAMVHNNMGQALQEEGRLTEAATWYQQALQLDPHSARFHSNLASALAEQENYAEALTRYEVALRLDPAHAEAHTGLARVLHEQGQFPEALAQLQQALDRKPDLIAALTLRATILEELGDLDQATACVEEALHCRPDSAAALGQLATLRKKDLPEDRLKTMLRLVGDPELADGRAAQLHFGLAQVFDARGDYPQAADHLRRANALRLALWRRQGKEYNPDEHSRFVDRLIAAFDADFFRRLHGAGSPDERPIFIVGLPRSATTLTEQILASHSRVFGAGELRLARDTFEALPALLRQPGATTWECLARLDGPAVRAVAEHYLGQLQALNADRPHVADKMPDNYLYLGLLAVLFPRARFIHTRRDPRDVAVSCWMTNFRQIRWANDRDHIARRFQDYLRLLRHWRQVLPVPLLEVDYEQTVADLEAAARKLVAWCGLEWEPGCIDFHQTRRPVRTASVLQVRKPIYSTSVERWKHYEHDLGGLFGRLGEPGG